jgi:hypothetical protein
MARRLALAGLLAVLAVSGAEARYRPPPCMICKEHFDATIEIADDSLSTSATLSTGPGHKFYDEVGDAFLRAFVNKKTGEVDFQVYGLLVHHGDWREFRGAAYQTDDGPEDVDTTDIADKVLGCYVGIGGAGCSVSESVGFDVPEAVLRIQAAKDDPATADGWAVKFKSRSGHDMVVSVPYGEISAILEAVERYRAARAATLGIESPK